MTNQINTDTPLDSHGVDPRAVPTTSISWPAAMRLRAARLPSKDALYQLAGSSEAYEALEKLADITDPRRRLCDGEIGHPALTKSDSHQDNSASETSLSSLYPAAFYQKPQWQFNDGTKAGFVAAKTLQAALDHARDVYGRFLKDCKAGPMTMQFIADRMKIDGVVHDLTDMDSFGVFYQSDDWTASQATAANLLTVGSKGFLYGIYPDQTAVITDASLISHSQSERAIAMKWDGVQFTQLFDYRDLYWKDL